MSMAVGLGWRTPFRAVQAAVYGINLSKNRSVVELRCQRSFTAVYGPGVPVKGLELVCPGTRTAAGRCAALLRRAARWRPIPFHVRVRVVRARCCALHHLRKGSEEFISPLKPCGVEHLVDFTSCMSARQSPCVRTCRWNAGCVHFCGCPPAAALLHLLGLCSITEVSCATSERDETQPLLRRTATSLKASRRSERKLKEHCKEMTRQRKKRRLILPVPAKVARKNSQSRKKIARKNRWKKAISA
ncbi:unnamed protein product [Rangifer tarandus platyrhynchus]|uniref:Uncharacterized protein n=1 Tax=Rangifer tarandus platyrhynchus TaxID=3082113 RepID=A0ABN8XJS9_RANTA|nr:unnamed protein product [Rangifer tarandus platyrhynchus]